MAGVVRTWRIELIEAYPSLFHPHADIPSAWRAIRGVTRVGTTCSSLFACASKRWCSKARSSGSLRSRRSILYRVTPDGFRIAPRRYDRETDNFVDVNPGSIAIEEE